MIGTTLGHYGIVEKIGAGGMGVVYRAHDERLDRDVAIKVLREEVASDPDRLRRFEVEARMVARLDHPNILAIHDLGTDQGVSYAVMELLQGVSLREVISRVGLTTKKAVAYAQSIADGLAAAHDRGVTHRDLKPENVFLTTDGRIKILDFGLAKLKLPEADLTTETPTATLDTAPRGLFGTVAYMAPEQVQGQHADQRSDIFTLGVILYEMLTGKRPFVGSTMVETAAAILKEDPEPIPSSVQGVPPTLAAVVEKCLEKRPEDRFSTAHDLSLTLGAIDTAASVPLVEDRTIIGKRWPHVLAVVIAAVIAMLVILPPEGLFQRSAGTGNDSPIRSIAILPLENLTGDPDQQYFVDGLHEDLIATFAQISGFDKVIARTSVMGFRDSETPIREIGKQLSVDAVLEGSVRRSGDTVRATLQLIDARTEGHLWAESFDRKLVDILALQSEMAETVTRAVNLSLSESEQDRLERTQRVDHDAYEAYLMGNHLSAGWPAEEDLTKAVDFYQLAIERDPEFARAYSGLARAYIGLYTRFRPAPQVMPMAWEAARKAVELDKSSGEAYAVLGKVKRYWMWDWPGAETAIRRSLELQPNSVVGRRELSRLQATKLDFDGAIANQRRAVELSPLSIRAHVDLGWIYWATRHYDDAASYLSGVIARHPDEIFGRMVLSWTLSFMGRTSESVNVAEATRDIHPAPLEDPFLLMTLVNAYGLNKEFEKANEILNRLIELRQTNYVPASYLAFSYTAIDDLENTVKWWQIAFEERGPQVTVLPILRGVKPDIDADPRMQALLEKLNVPEE